MKASEIKKLRQGICWTQTELGLYLCVKRLQVTRMERPSYVAKGITLALLRRLMLMKTDAITDPAKWQRPPKQFTADDLKVLRYRRGYPQVEMAMYLHVSPNYYCQLETGAKGISQRMRRLLECLSS